MQAGLGISNVKIVVSNSWTEVKHAADSCEEQQPPLVVEMSWLDNLPNPSPSFAIPVEKAVDFEMESGRDFDMGSSRSVAPDAFSLAPAPAVNRIGKYNQQ